MPLSIWPDPETACLEAARSMTRTLEAVLRERDQAVLAVSGGSTPWPMLATFFKSPLPWPRIHLFQVDERLVSPKSPERNWSHLVPLLPPGIQCHPVPSDPSAQGDDLARLYEAELIRISGNPPRIDLIHLGLGGDGHTASLAPGHAVLAIEDRWVASVGAFHGEARLTLTRPTLNRAVHRLWLACGSDKQEALARWIARDPAIPAGRVGSREDPFFCDQAAAPPPGTAGAQAPGQKPH